MKKLLVISSSPSVSTSISRQLVTEFSDTFRNTLSDAEITFRDVGATPPPHLDEQTIGAFYTPQDQLTDNQKDAIALSDTLVDELEAADVIVIGAPMHNFSISAHLKTYLDQITRVGRTFQYTDSGPKGLLTDKKVYVLTSRGGNYSNAPMDALDHQEPYLKTILGFLGLDDITFFHTQGIAMGDEVRDQSVSETKTAISASISSL